MSEELEINGEQFLPSKVAAKQVGYTGDYVGRLAREERIRARKVGKTWFVSIDSLKAFVENAEVEKNHKRQKLREERKQELKSASTKNNSKGKTDTERTSAPSRTVYLPKLSRSKQTADEKPSAVGRSHALAETLTVLMLGLFFGTSGYLISSTNVAGTTPSGTAFLESLAISVYETLTPGAEHIVASSVSEVSEADAEAARDEVKETVAGDAGELRPQEISSTTSETNTPQDVRKKAASVIEESFSDEVEIAFDETRPNAAVVFPVFEDGRGESYEFVIVPMSKHAGVGVRPSDRAMTASSSEDNDGQN